MRIPQQNGVIIVVLSYVSSGETMENVHSVRAVNSIIQKEPKGKELDTLMRRRQRVGRDILAVSLRLGGVNKVMIVLLFMLRRMRSEEDFDSSFDDAVCSTWSLFLYMLVVSDFRFQND